MGEYEDLPYIVIERHSGGGVAPFLWGALLGAGVALLLAPRSGAETQEEIRGQARRLRTAAEERVGDARDRVTGAVTRTRDRIQGQIDTVRDAVETRTEQARHVVDTGRRAAREARGELRRRLDDARESYAGMTDSLRGGDEREPATPPAGEIVITDVIIEETDLGPELG